MKQRIIICLFIMLPHIGSAGVDPRHGLFYISYTDVDFPGGKIDITRSYSSSRSTTGLFGYGWATLLETKIFALPDGTLSLNWWGNVMGDYYEPAVIQRSGLFEMVNAIVKELLKTNKIDNNPASIAEKKSYYLINNKERASKYIELLQKKRVPAYVPVKKQQWVLDVNQVIEWNGTEFTAKSWEDRYHFNAAGQLIYIKDRNYKMLLSYQAQKLSSITVDDSSICKITTNEKGRIVELNALVGGIVKKAFFKYDSTDNLIYSKDAGNNEYWYNYDLYHNMVRINYSNSTSLEVTYDGATNRVIKLKDTKGAVTTYQYPYFYTAEGRVNYDHYATRIKRFDSLGNLVFTDYKEYENRTKNDGSSYMYRVLETSDTSYHEILYDGEVGNASYRKKNKHEAWSIYDSKRRPAYLRLRDSVFKTSYNMADLPEYFSQLDSLSNTGISYHYTYNDAGELVHIARNDETFILHHQKENKLIEIEKLGGQILIIQQMPDSSCRLKAGKYPAVVFSKEEWKKFTDSAAIVVGATAGKISTAYEEDPVRRTALKKQIQETLKKAAIAKRARDGGQKSGDDDELQEIPGDLRQKVKDLIFKLR